MWLELKYDKLDMFETIALSTVLFIQVLTEFKAEVY